MLQAEGTEVNSKEMLAKSTFTEMDKNGDGKVKTSQPKTKTKTTKKKRWTRMEMGRWVLAISSLHPCWPHAVTQLVGQRFKIAFERLSYDRAGDIILFFTYTRWHRQSNSLIPLIWICSKSKSPVFIIRWHRLSSPRQFLATTSSVVFLPCLSCKCLSELFKEYKYKYENKFRRLLVASVMQMFVWALEKNEKHFKGEKALIWSAPDKWHFLR